MVEHIKLKVRDLGRYQILDQYSEIEKNWQTVCWATNMKPITDRIGSFLSMPDVVVDSMEGF